MTEPIDGPRIAQSPAMIATGVTRDRTIMFVVLALSAVFLFVDTRTMPIVLWDESRNMINALEMKRTGLSLVTTYQGAPDLWNTKPPLLIWLMTGSATLFGSSEWALRLPSMVAAIAMLAMMMVFVKRVTRSAATAALAVALLAISPCWFGEHSGRTADYEALLIFFTTAYLFLLFRAVHSTRPSLPLLLAAGAVIAGAVLTKSVAGVIPGVGVGLYLIAIRRMPRLWRGPNYLWLAMSAFLPVAAFLMAREAQAPGYVHAILHNDTVGRFEGALTGIDRTPWHYVKILWAGYFSVTPLLLLSPLALRRVSNRTRLLLLFSLAVTVAQLVVISAAGTKLNHYIAPAMPFMAIAAAITLRAIVSAIPGVWASDRPGSKLIAASLALLAAWPLFVATQSAIARRYVAPERTEGARSGLYGALFASLSTQGATRITVVDTGFLNDGDAHYAPVLQAYRLIWAERGLTVDREWDLGKAADTHGIVASCDPAAVRQVLMRGADIGGVGGCVAVRADESRR